MSDIVPKEGAKCYGYIRVSTDKQENSPEAQSKILRDWAAKEGHPIELVYDLAVSAAKMDFEKRPGGRELLNRLRPGDVLAAARLDRLFRRGAEIALLRRMAAQDIRIVTVIDNLPDPNTPVGKYIQGNFVLIHELEAAIIGSRIRETMAYRKSVGLPVNGWGKYGHTIEHGDSGAEFKVNEAEMVLIRDASTRRLAGESCQDIADDFTRREYVSPHINPKTGQPRPWDRKRVERVTWYYWMANNIQPPDHAVCDRPTPEEQEQQQLRAINDAQNRPQYIIKGRRLNRLRCPEEKCPECGTLRGMYHVPRCGQEQCPQCDSLMGDCECKVRLPRRARRKQYVHKSHRRLTWKDAGWFTPEASSLPLDSTGGVAGSTCSEAPTDLPPPDAPSSGPPEGTGG